MIAFVIVRNSSPDKTYDLEIACVYDESGACLAIDYKASVTTHYIYVINIPWYFKLEDSDYFSLIRRFCLLLQELPN